AVLPGLGRIPEVDHGVRRIVVPNRQVVVAGAATATTAATPPAAAGGGRVGSALRGLLLRGLRGLLALLPLLRRLLFLPGRGLLLLVLVLQLGVGLLASLGSGVVAALPGGVTTSATAAAPPAPTPPTPVRAAALRSPRLLLGGAPGLGGRLFRLGLRSRLQLLRLRRQEHRLGRGEHRRQVGRWCLRLVLRLGGRGERGLRRTSRHRTRRLDLGLRSSTA